MMADGSDSVPGIPKSDGCWVLRPAIACGGRIRVEVVPDINGNDTGFAAVDTPNGIRKA